MGANAARPLLEGIDPAEIGMIIVGTEGSVDFGKPISTNIHGALGLGPNMRSYETKHACYSGVAALDTAVNWIAAGLHRGRKALVIAADFSRRHFHKDHEFVLGGAAAAVLVSDKPQIVEYELQKKGSFTQDVYDTFRPTAQAEMGNNEVSLYSYQDSVEGAYLDYLAAIGLKETDIDIDAYFKHNIYHMPFPGMALLGHRVVCRTAGIRKKSEVQAHFEKKTLPSLRYAQRVGSTYGASNFVGLTGLLASAEDIAAGDRIGFFSYGSGCMGEFYSGLVLPEARKRVLSMGIDAALDARRMVPVAEYEKIENQRVEGIENPNWTPDFSVADNWYDAFYAGKQRLVLREVKEFERRYEWS
jgi:hydroxymethylglutaryl-CoA synthase